MPDFQLENAMMRHNQCKQIGSVKVQHTPSHSITCQSLCLTRQNSSNRHHAAMETPNIHHRPCFRWSIRPQIDACTTPKHDLFLQGLPLVSSTETKGPPRHQMGSNGSAVPRCLSLLSLTGELAAQLAHLMSEL